jgi:hypothetical protein
MKRTICVLVLSGFLGACSGEWPASPGSVLMDVSASSCQKIAGQDIAQFTSATTAVGTLSGDLEGTFDAVIDQILPGDDGSLHLIAHRTITNALGTITTSDGGVLSPELVPLYGANGHYDFVSGTGAYANVSGGIRIHGEVNLGTGAVVLRYKGTLCE